MPNLVNGYAIQWRIPDGNNFEGGLTVVTPELDIDEFIRQIEEQGGAWSWVVAISDPPPSQVT